MKKPRSREESLYRCLVLHIEDILFWKSISSMCKTRHMYKNILEFMGLLLYPELRTKESLTTTGNCVTLLHSLEILTPKTKHNVAPH